MTARATLGTAPVVNDRVRVLIEPNHPESPPKGTVGRVMFVDEPEMYEVQFPRGAIGAYWRHELEIVR